ncbi:bifunctional D-glycero-beta-D-manno-heptose-7-phosphate kinase/D-glycero-beta-D-manno-heptose 1-phosphate adenylyltransferase HldE [Ectothiorhodospiraceae bacterium 2226]|nr:bifunctional D-glycero-beta-D-manno-heptose-7-phosphate kinase/D-glycero-beta-D-manno-heptose 1-phosphate adenylyltransferase HldE [Ectothiorhodospiraceae bacterium 2226]
MTIHVPDFSTVRALVVGDLMLDRYWYGATSRISPEAPVPVVHISEAEERAGGAGNVALNIAALGAQVALAGLVGDDDAGRALCRALEGTQVKMAIAEVPGLATITKLRVLSRHQQLIRLDFEDGFHRRSSELLAGIVEAQLSAVDVLVLSDYAKGTLCDAQAFIRLGREAGVPVLVDPKGLDFSRYRGATMLTPNQHEFELVAGRCEYESDLVGRGMGMIEALELEALLITRGERGMTLLRRNDDPLHFPAEARDVYDVTGAGDTVIAVLAATLAAVGALPAASALANRAAGIVVGKLGAATVSREELKGDHDPQLPQGVIDEDRLVEQVQAARARGERIVMTNGCFDILHPGHVQYLEQARRLGDRLVVAVNDDASVRRLKGEGRPINSGDDRMTVLAGLRSVDWVVPFSEDTPERLICRIKPQVLVKGGDYRPDEVAGGECVSAAGGDVRILRYLEGCSTTSIIGAIRDLRGGGGR